MAAKCWRVAAPRGDASSFRKEERLRHAFGTYHQRGPHLICVCAAPAGLTFPARRRLRRKSDFEAAYAGGKRLGNGFFGVVAIWNEKSGPRLGLAVAVHVAGNAVERNRIRRIIRESFRLHQHELPPVDLVVSARSRARSAQADKLSASLAALWRSVADQHSRGQPE